MIPPRPQTRDRLHPRCSLGPDPQSTTATRAEAEALLADGDRLRVRLGLDDLPKGARVVAAMSGGVDSTVVAALLRRIGFQVVGVTLQLYDQGSEGSTASRTCCAGRDINDARRAAAAVGMPHYVLDFEARFRRSVIEPFAQSYREGRTPVPCITCNQTVKFHDLLEITRSLGSHALVTGHYVRLVRRGGRRELHRGADPRRDQSYFLFATTDHALELLRFPLGGLPKPLVRALGDLMGLRGVSSKPDSQDICFVPKGNYRSVVASVGVGDEQGNRSGNMIDVQGRVLGRHNGVENFTVGQRRGIGIGGRKTGNDPLYVVAIDPKEKTVTVGAREHLAVASVTVEEVNLIGDCAPMPVPPPGSPNVTSSELPHGDAEIPLNVRFRSSMAPVEAQARFSADGRRCTVAFARAQYGVSPGQACVFYRDTRMLGGGWIRSTNPARPSLPGPQPNTRTAGVAAGG